MIYISNNIKKLPKKDLKRWIADREKKETSQDWKDELAKLKERYVSRVSKSSKED